MATPTSTLSAQQLPKTDAQNPAQPKAASAAPLASYSQSTLTPAVSFDDIDWALNRYQPGVTHVTDEMRRELDYLMARCKALAAEKV